MTSTRGIVWKNDTRIHSKHKINKFENSENS